MPTIKVQYEVTCSDKEFDRVVRLAKDEGLQYEDAGPVLSVQRLLMNQGIDGAFPDEHILGLQFTLKTNPA